MIQRTLPQGCPLYDAISEIYKLIKSNSERVLNLEDLIDRYHLTRGQDSEEAILKIVNDLKDKAMISSRYPKKTAWRTINPSGPGGINLNPAQMSLHVKRDGQDFKFDFNGAPIDAAQVIGATFTIKTMVPVIDLAGILDPR